MGILDSNFCEYIGVSNLWKGVLTVVFLCCVPGAGAQDSAVSGHVIEAGTNLAISGAMVRIRAVIQGAVKESETTTAPDGSYRFNGLPSGTHRLSAWEPARILGAASRDITLDGHELTDVNIRLTAQGFFTGQIRDSEKRPIAGVTVYLISQEYYKGRIDRFTKHCSTSDKNGEYRISAPAGRPWRLYAEQPLAAATVKRTPVPRNTWYPNSPFPEGAVPLTLHPGQTLEALNIEMADTDPLCIAGSMTTPTGPASLVKFTL